MSKSHNDLASRTISERAKGIRAKIAEVGNLYGIPLDMDNADYMIVAAYTLAENESLRRVIEGMVLDILGDRGTE